MISVVQVADLKHKLVHNRCSIIENQPRCIFNKKFFDKKIASNRLFALNLGPNLAWTNQYSEGFVYSILDLEEAKLNKPDGECDKNQEWATGKSQLLKGLSWVRGSTLLCSAIFHVVGQLPRSGEDFTHEKTKKERKR